MQGTKIRLLTGGLLMMAAASYVQADALQPDGLATRDISERFSVAGFSHSATSQ